MAFEESESTANKELLLDPVYSSTIPNVQSDLGYSHRIRSVPLSRSTIPDLGYSHRIRSVPLSRSTIPSVQSIGYDSGYSSRIPSVQSIDQSSSALSGSRGRFFRLHEKLQ